MVAPPYSRFAPAYDVAIGVPAFGHFRRSFEQLVRRYGITFDSAADIGCGTGLFACYLRAAWGVPVFAVDRSAEMLEVALERGGAPGLFFLRQDIRCLRLPLRVELITANHDTLNHLLRPADLKRAFRRIRENLEPGGYFIFDLVTERLPGAVRALRLRIPGCDLEQRIHWDPESNLISMVIARRSIPFEVHRERVYHPVVVARWLREAGFIVRGIHDAMTLDIATRQSPRVTVVAERPRRVATPR